MSLTIKPLSAQLMKNYDMNSKQDPYCTVFVGDQKLKTAVHKESGLHPVWDDVLVFTLSEETEVVFKLYDKDVINDDFIGEGKITIEDVKNSKLDQQIVTLTDKKGEHAGSLMFKMHVGEMKNEGKKKDENKEQEEKQENKQ